MNPSLLTALVIVILMDGIGWSMGVIPVLRYALVNKAFPFVGSIQLMGGGPFDQLGIPNMIVAGIVFVVVSAFKVLAAYWLWHSRMDGAVLELILLALSTIFWYGFALPLGPVFGITQVVLLGLVWGNLSP